MDSFYYMALRDRSDAVRELKERAEDWKELLGEDWNYIRALPPFITNYLWHADDDGDKEAWKREEIFTDTGGVYLYRAMTRSLDNHSMIFRNYDTLTATPGTLPTSIFVRRDSRTEKNYLTKEEEKVYYTYTEPFNEDTIPYIEDDEGNAYTCMTGEYMGQFALLRATHMELLNPPKMYTHKPSHWGKLGKIIEPYIQSDPDFAKHLKLGFIYDDKYTNILRALRDNGRRICKTNKIIDARVVNKLSWLMLNFQMPIHIITGELSLKPLWHDEWYNIVYDDIMSDINKVIEEEIHKCMPFYQHSIGNKLAAFGMEQKSTMWSAYAYPNSERETPRYKGDPDNNASNGCIISRESMIIARSAKFAYILHPKTKNKATLAFAKMMKHAPFQAWYVLFIKYLEHAVPQMFKACNIDLKKQENDECFSKFLGENYNALRDMEYIDFMRDFPELNGMTVWGTSNIDITTQKKE